MTFNQLIEYHNKQLIITLKSDEQYKGIIVSHTFSDDNRRSIATLSLLDDKINRIECAEISQIKIL
jgi:hypothetical protein